MKPILVSIAVLAFGILLSAASDPKLDAPPSTLVAVIEQMGQPTLVCNPDIVRGNFGEVNGKKPPKPVVVLAYKRQGKLVYVDEDAKIMAISSDEGFVYPGDPALSPPAVAAVPSSREPAPMDIPSPLAIEEVVVCRAEERNAGARASGRASYRVIAKMTNRGTALIVMPVMLVSLDPAPENVEHCAASFMIFPGETKVFCTGGLTTTPEILEKAVTAKLDLESKDRPYEFSGHWRQIEFLHSLSFAAPTFEFFRTNHFASVKGEFQNPAGLHLKSVSGTAVFLDDDGHLVDAGPFGMDPRQSIPAGGWGTGSEMSGIEKAKRCVLQVDYFQEE